MSINIAIRYSHPSVTSAKIRYARIDNTNTPVWIPVAGDKPVSTVPTGIVVATDVPNGQYDVEVTPIYPDLRICNPDHVYTDACPGLLSISAYINLGNIYITWEAPASVPKGRLTVNYPNGGNSSLNYINTGGVNTSVVPVPPGATGVYTIFGQSVCDESTEFYSQASNQVTVNNSGNINPISGLYTLSNTTGTVCNQSPVLLYTNGAFAVGGILYQDSLLSIPVTGFSYVATPSPGNIYTLNTLTGEIVTNTGQACSVIITNQIMTNGYVISTVSNIPGFTLGNPLVGGDQYVGTRTNSNFTATIQVNVSASIPAFGKLTLRVNGIVVQCVNVSGNGTYTFPSTTINAADSIFIQSETGSC